MTEPMLSPGSVIDDRFTIVRAIGAGAMAEVYEATGPDGTVALKVMRGKPSPERVPRFLREGKVASTLTSRHVVPVLERGLDGAHALLFLTMPLLRGRDLAAVIKDQGALDPGVAVRLVVDAAEGVAELHRAGVVHRDIKPSNLFAHETDDGEIVVKVCDLGIAKDDEERLAALTQTGTVLGSPLYMAPEQLLSARGVDTRADVWSLAMTLYELLAGVPALDGSRSFAELVGRLAAGDFPDVTTAAPWIPRGLGRVIGEALQVSKDARCPSVEALRAGLGPFADPAPRLLPSALRAVDRRLRSMRPRAPGAHSTRPPARPHVGERVAPGAARDVTARPHVGERVAPGAARDVTARPDVGERVAPGASIPPEYDVFGLSAIASPDTVAGWGTVSSVELIPDPSPVPDPRLGELVGGRFRLTSLLGQGGMGSVYEADGPDGKVAVKLVTTEDDPVKQQRFVREARAAMAIRHANVVRVVEADTDPAGGLPYIAMELLSGTDLEGFLRRHGPLEPGVACRLFVDACRGLAAAHALSIVHRDIKPANLFLHTLPGGEIVTKVCDFGIAKDFAGTGADNATMTHTTGLLGSPMYMSPEQARSAKDVDPRSDVWSVCLTLYEALSGRKAWPPSSLGELLLAICTTDVTPLVEVAPWVSPDLASVVHRGLTRDRKDRWESIEALAAALERLAIPGPVEARTLLAVSASMRAQTVADTGSGGDATRAEPRGAAEARDTVATESPVSTSPGSRRAITAAQATRSSVPRWIAGGVAVVAVLGVVAFANRAPRVAQPAVVASAPVADARVSVRPSSATVTVGGKPVPLDDGRLRVEGRPGDVFEITVTTEAGTSTHRIVIARDGTAVPPVVDGPPPRDAVEGARAPASASATDATGTTGRPRDASKTPGSKPKASAAPARPLPPSDTPIRPKMHDEP